MKDETASNEAFRIPEASRNPKTFSALCVKGHIWKDSSSTVIFLEGSLKTTAQNGPSEVMWPGQAAQRASSSLISTQFDDITPRQRCEICTYKYSFIQWNSKQFSFLLSCSSVTSFHCLRSNLCIRDTSRGMFTITKKLKAKKSNV